MSIFSPTARRRRICRGVVALLVALAFAVVIGVRLSASMRDRDGLWAAVFAVDLLAAYATYGIWFRCEHCQRLLQDGWSRARYCPGCGKRLG